MNSKAIIPAILGVITIVEIAFAGEVWASIGLWCVYGIYRAANDPK